MTAVTTSISTAKQTTSGRIVKVKTKRFLIQRTTSGTYNRKPFTFTREIELDAVDADDAQRQVEDLFLHERADRVEVVYKVQPGKIQTATVSSRRG